ncbi:CBS domain-containing protein CBSX3, mitochondrial [Vitis vinifera]|uniref:CBS domain-containing protein CBSX3, mitochondrial n=1 Tax=Vitis vinifera TaxID=29760 RepID=A0A438F8X5_VITVI|nr:CBS domain-containing protein CBSX3, mitochondrial [Vitis vinifera]
MQGAIQAIVSHGSIVKNAVLHQIRLVNPIMPSVVFSRLQSVTSARMEEHGFESTTIADVLKGKGKSADGSWLWCTTDDSVYDAVKSMTHHNVGALVVVKPGEQKSIAGIITERGKWRIPLFTFLGGLCGVQLKWHLRFNDFLWGESPEIKPHFVDGSIVYIEKKNRGRGGLATRSFFVLNEALIDKWTWRFAMEMQGLWKKVL